MDAEADEYYNIALVHVRAENPDASEEDLHQKASQLGKAFREAKNKQLASDLQTAKRAADRERKAKAKSQRKKEW